MQPDVVIAGAGPVGLMLAAELRLAGVAVTVVDRLTEPTAQSRAIGVHARTLEVWDQRGIADRFAGPTIPHYGYAGGLVDLQFGPLGTRFGLRLLPQTRTEQGIGSWAAELGVDLRRGHELTGLLQADDEVEITVAGPDGEYQLTAQWVVGCDGGRSTVRRLAGFGFPGTESTVEFLMTDVIDVPPGTPFLTEIPFVRRSEFGHLMVLPVLPDAFRVILYEFGRPPSGVVEPPSFEDLCAVAQRIGGLDISGATPRWRTRLGNACRQADSYRRGRVLLAGDAAHIHLPAAGQGLNLGVQDAVNLGWKLAAEINGHAPAGLLDSYETERAPVAAGVLVDTQAQFALLAGGPEAEALRTVFADVMRIDEANRLIAGTVSALSVRYDVGDQDGAGGHPLLGARLPYYELTVNGELTDTMRLLHPARGVLLAVDADPAFGVLADGWSDLVDVVEAKAGGDWVDGVRALLVRPDGHVAWVGSETDVDEKGLVAALRRWFGDPVS